MTQVHDTLIELGIPRDRLAKVLDYKDNWGHLVYAYEALTVMGVVLQHWPKEDGE